MLRSETMPSSSGMMGTSRPAEDAGGAVFDFEDMQALREEYEERLRRLEREKDASLDVVRRDAGQRMAALRAEQEARLAAESEMRQQLIEELTIELASAREEGENVARAAERRRLASEDKLRFALGEIDRMAAELSRLREVLQAHLAPPASAAAAPTAPLGGTPLGVVPLGGEPPALPADSLVTSVTSVTAAAGFASRKKKIRLR